MHSAHAGAFACFEGWVRNHNENKNVVALEYEACASLCDKEGARIIEETKNKFAVLEVRCLHRVGKLDVGERAVWIGVTSAHRDDAFGACRFVIDEVKARLPIWKKEFYDTGDSGWIGCEGCRERSK